MERHGGKCFPWWWMGLSWVIRGATAYSPWQGFLVLSSKQQWSMRNHNPARVWAQLQQAARAADAPWSSCPCPPVLPWNPQVQFWMQSSPSLLSALLFFTYQTISKDRIEVCWHTFSTFFPFPFAMEHAGCWDPTLSGSQAGLCIGLSLPHQQDQSGSSQQLPDTGHNGHDLRRGLFTPPWRPDRHLLEHPLKAVKAWRGMFSLCTGSGISGNVSRGGANLGWWNQWQLKHFYTRKSQGHGGGLGSCRRFDVAVLGNYRFSACPMGSFWNRCN